MAPVLAIAALGFSPAVAQPGDGGRLLRLQVEAATASKDRTPASGRAAIVSMNARDPATGFPIDGLRPALWIVPDDGGDCESWYRRIAGSPILPDGVVPLVGYDLIQATPGGRVAVIDPLLNLASANIRAVHNVAGTIRDWAIGRDGRTMAIITGPAPGGEGALRLLSLDGSGVETAVVIPAAATDIVAVDDAYWVGLADGSVLRVDPSGAAGRPVPVGAGPVSLIARAGGKAEEKAAAIAGDGRMLLIDGDRAGKAAAFGRPVGAAAHALLADAVFALTRDGGSLLYMPLDAPGRVTAIPLPATYRAIAADPKGGFVALLAADGGRLSLFDTAQMRLRWSIDIPDPAIEMLFSDNFLYVLHTRQSGVTRVIFDAQGGPPGLAAIAAGIPSTVPQFAGRLGHMVRIPGAGIIVASSRERTAYMVSEDGAQAAMSSLPLRAGLTDGIALRLRGPLPTGQKGGYAARFTPRYGGKYLAVAQIDNPALLHCAPFAVSGAPDPQRQPAVAAATDGMRLSAGFDQAELKVSLRGVVGDPAPGRAILVATAGNWRRLLAAPVQRGPGDFVFPAAGVPNGAYRLFLDLGQAGTVETEVVRSPPAIASGATTPGSPSQGSAPRPSVSRAPSSKGSE